jgi:hypothetical protein
MVELASKCESLKHLSISNCKYLSDATLSALGRNCEELCTFECAGCSNFSDNGFSPLTKVLYACLPLHFLFLNFFCQFFNSKIIQNCHHLMRIDLEDCERVSEKLNDSILVDA